MALTCGFIKSGVIATDLGKDKVLPSVHVYFKGFTGQWDVLKALEDSMSDWTDL